MLNFLSIAVQTDQISLNAIFLRWFICFCSPENNFNQDLQAWDCRGAITKEINLCQHLLFFLAMINRRKPADRTRYMIGTALLMIGPGPGRALIIFGGIPFPVAITIVYGIGELIALLLLFSDFRKKANINLLPTVLIILVINHIAWVFQESIVWQKIAKGFVTIAF